MIIKPPKLFIPHDYQREQLAFQTVVPRKNVFAHMGTGKTPTTLLSLVIQAITDDVFPALVLAPLRVAQSTWPDEQKKWSQFSTLRVSPVVGDAKTRLKMLTAPAEIYTINYENIPWLIETLRGRWPFRSVIADESTRLKGFRLRQGGMRARALAKVAHGPTDYWHNLTGTPAAKGYDDLWGQTWFIDQGKRLGISYGAFIDRFFSTVQVGEDKHAVRYDLRMGAKDEILRRLSDVSITIEFPWREEPITSDVWVDLPSKARQQYDAMERELFLEIQGKGIEAFSAGAKTMKCRQLASGALYLDETCTTFAEVHDVKLQALESIINEANGAPVLVAYYFQHSLARILKAFKGARTLDADPQTIRDWNAGKIPILLAHPKSAGHGLNLQDGGNILAVYDHDWALEEYLQILERIGPTRQKQSGHDRPVYVYNILARGTTDEAIKDNREGKTTVQEAFMQYFVRRRAA